MNVPWTNPTLQEIYQGQTSFNTSANVYELPTANVWVYVIIETTFAESHPMHLHGQFILCRSPSHYIPVLLLTFY